MKILLIDDQPEVRDIMSLILFQELEANVIECSNPIEAVSHLSDSEIKLIICDYNLPKQNGLEFFNSLQNDNHIKIPFLLITGMSFDDDDRRLIEFRKSKLNKLILKPFDEDDLLDEIRSVLKL